MGGRSLSVMSLLLGFLTSGVAAAATSPANAVQQFIEAHLQGRFAEARGVTIEQVNLSSSLFSNWLFGTGGAGAHAATADVFLSRKFAQAFRYRLIDTTPNGDNQVTVLAIRSSPNLVHMYTWALAPKRGAAPYELIEAIDTYLTKVNFPIEESRMQFTLIREVGEWYISMVYDEKFVQLQQEWVSQQPLSAAPPPPGQPRLPPPGAAVSAPAATSPPSGNTGRQAADAQFNATLQSFNQAHQSPGASAPGQPQEEEKSGSFLTRLFGGRSKEPTVVQMSTPDVKKTFNNIRDALARYAVSHNDFFPEITRIYDWDSLRNVVNRHGTKPLPATEEAAGFRFVQYRSEPAHGNYALLVELLEPEDGLDRVEVTPLGVLRAN